MAQSSVREGVGTRAAVSLFLQKRGRTQSDGAVHQQRYTRDTFSHTSRAAKEPAEALWLTDTAPSRGLMKELLLEF